VKNAGSQLCIKLDGENYPAWRIQFMALLTVYDLMGYVDGTKECPSKHLDIIHYNIVRGILIHYNIVRFYNILLSTLLKTVTFAPF
jgi:hypothetical protein